MQELAIGCLALALILLHAAWLEYRRSNLRDAGLLAAVGTAGAAGSAALWFH